MNMLYLLIFFSLLIAVSFLGFFIWAVRSGQYGDIETPSMRILTEEDMKKTETNKRIT